MSPWQPMETAPKDGTKIDLLYPYPRNRMIDAFWHEQLECWACRTPTWMPSDDGRSIDLLPEDKWHVASYHNMEPLCWMPCPEMPEGISFKFFEEDNSL